jgi:hypothetical protein
VVTLINKRLSGWKSRSLFYGGCLILLKFVLTSLSVYAISFFKTPLDWVSRFVAMAVCLSAIDLSTSWNFGCSWRSYMTQTGPLNVSIFAWRLLRDKLPTRVNLEARGIISPETQYCVAGCGCMESAQHLFLYCSIFGSL